jgi:hypothetical protein
MSLSSLSSDQLHSLIKFIKEKEMIQAKLARVERSLSALEGGKVAKREPSVKKRSSRRLRRPALKRSVLKALESVGKKGLSVKEVAKSIKAKPASVSVWFYTTGKKVKGLMKIGPGRYAYLP